MRNSIDPMAENLISPSTTNERVLNPIAPMASVGNDSIIEAREDGQSLESLSKKVVADENNSLNSKPSAYLTMCAMIAAINSCNLGYDEGVSTGLVHSFTRGGSNGLRFSSWQIELFVGILNFAALIGALIMPYLSDKYGRRFVFLVSQVVFIVGILCMVVASNYAMLMLGRFIMGIGLGLGFAVDPMYIAEVAPAQIRGRLVSWAETADNVGILFGFASTWAFSGEPGNAQWRGMAAIGLIMPIVLLFLVVFYMPESPRWLIQNGRKAEASEILRKCSSDPNADGAKLADTMQTDIDEEYRQSYNVTWSSIIKDKVSLRKLRAGLGTAVAQQLCGINALQYYMLIILSGAGVSNSNELYSSLIGIGAAKTGTIIVAGYLFDSFGRRFLLQISNAGMVVALVLLGVVSYITPEAGIAALMMFMVAFSSGMGPGAWLIPSEVFSNDIRAKGLSMCTVSNRVVSLIVVSTFLSLKSTLTAGGVFFMYALFTTGNILYIRAFVPETRGRSLESVHELFED